MGGEGVTSLHTPRPPPSLPSCPNKAAIIVLISYESKRNLN